MRVKKILLITFFAFVCDRLTKIYFVQQPNASIVVQKNLLILELHKNTGIIFGFVVNNLLFYLLFSLLSLTLFYILVDTYRQKNIFLFSCLAFIIIGAYSNLLDRLQYGGVIDFINVPFWSIFNLADIYIVLAIIIWCIKLMKHEQISKKS